VITGLAKAHTQILLPVIRSPPGSFVGGHYPLTSGILISSSVPIDELDAAQQLDGMPVVLSVMSVKSG
jgi:hypothetical protein